jgi:hypothetical protein
MYKAAAVLSALMKVCAIPCHDRGYINIMMVLQSCADSLHILPSSSSENYATPSDGVCNSSNVEVEEDVVIIEEGLMAIHKEADMGIKQEEIPEDITFSSIKSEPDEVSSMCVYVYWQTHVTIVQKYQLFFCDVSISGQLKQLICWE